MFMASLEVADREAIDGRLLLRRLLDLLFQLRAAECLHNYAHTLNPLMFTCAEPHGDPHGAARRFAQTAETPAFRCAQRQ